MGLVVLIFKFFYIIIIIIILLIIRVIKTNFEIYEWQCVIRQWCRKNASFSVTSFSKRATNCDVFVNAPLPVASLGSSNVDPLPDKQEKTRH
jgi:hypothetical protein